MLDFFLTLMMTDGKGAQLAKIEIGDKEIPFEVTLTLSLLPESDRNVAIQDPMLRNLVAEASCDGVTTYGDPQPDED